jgi:hypothetical protein
VDPEPQKSQEGYVWRGLWKGGKISKSRKKKERESGVTEDSMEIGEHGRRQVEKFFNEPEYHGVSVHYHLQRPS